MKFPEFFNEKKTEPWSANFRCISGYFPSLKILKIKHIWKNLLQEILRISWRKSVKKAGSILKIFFMKIHKKFHGISSSKCQSRIKKKKTQKFLLGHS
jgi:hypothetical protein